MSLPVLSLAETRVLGVLVEKQRAVPDIYPLSLNALTAGCNQKTSRDPVLEIPEAEVQATLERLRAVSLVIESSGGRVMRYAHNLERVLDVPAPAVALLAVLMLRGAQTAGELRINAERLHRFADISTVEGYLHELAQRSSGALVTELPRTAGTRETRWAHLLSGAPALTAADGGPAAASAGGFAAAPGRAPAAVVTQASDAGDVARRLESLEQELAQLRTELAELRATLRRDAST